MRIQRRAIPEGFSIPNCHPIIEKILLSRGITNAASLELVLPNLPSFNLLLNIHEAVDLLVSHILADKHIMIIGDYDADGATSTALAMAALTAFGAEHVSYLVPNRFEFGYGLSPELVTFAKKYQPDLLVTVDNGISNHSGVEQARAYGMQVLITDHHLPGAQLPEAHAIINPNLPGDGFPSKNLAGVGVIFYVMTALRSQLRENNWFSQKNIPDVNMAEFLDLVALGTVADVVKLDTINRILVHQGLRRIRANRARPGIVALLATAQRVPEKLVAADLGFAVGPRLNAAGRLDDMSIGIRCLLSKSYQEALTHAEILNQLNIDRRDIEQEMQAEALAELQALHLSTDKLPGVSICLYQQHWHQGVIGILGGRIKDKYHKPTIVFAKVSNKELKGSARSIPGVHIRDVLADLSTENPGLIVKFGGHAMAAGVSITPQSYHDFKRAFEQMVARHVAPELLHKTLLVDGELTSKELNLPFAYLLQNYGPWGQDFPEPTFIGEFVFLEQRLVGHKHLKLTLKLPNNSICYQGIYFNVDLDVWPDHRIKQAQVVYQLVVNEFNGRESMQLMVCDIILPITQEREFLTTLVES